MLAVTAPNVHVLVCMYTCTYAYAYMYVCVYVCDLMQGQVQGQPVCVCMVHCRCGRMCSLTVECVLLLILGKDKSKANLLAVTAPKPAAAQSAKTQVLIKPLIPNP